MEIKNFFEAFRQDIWVPLLFGAAALLLYLGANSFFGNVTSKIRRSIRESAIPLDILLWPFRYLVVAALFAALVNVIQLPPFYLNLARHALIVFSIIGIVWFCMRLLVVFEQFLLQHYPEKIRESETGRKNATYISLARKILNVLLVLVGVSGILMSFDTVRQVGLSILASAGIAGVILGFAAQKSLSTLISGIQIAVTQPISINDVVVVEKQWGRIEEITLTYVVVRLWNEHRLIVPISWFLERPFENWTRTSPELLDTVFIYTDYAVPLDMLRKELERIVSVNPLWDRRVVKMHVTDFSDKSLEIRALVSAANASDMWELRCQVREQLLEFIRQNIPEVLPKVRMEMDQSGFPRTGTASE
ncbi:MAG: mechanosensitive ion channel [Chlorobiaceae bacterium]|nr:mechanosensitive ion channel [Chlorobiaceae bacterium]